MQGRPVDGLHGCLVLGELGEGLRALRGPYEQLVVVATRGQLVLVVEAPTETTDFLTVLCQFHVACRGRSQVSDQDRAVFATRREDGCVQVVPGKRADPGEVAVEGPHLLFLIDVPDLNLARFSSNAQMAALVRPTQRSHLVEIPKVAELRNRQRCRIPNIHRGLKSHRKNVLRRPVNQV